MRYTDVCFFSLLPDTHVPGTTLAVVLFTGNHINQDPPCTQKPIYTPIFTHHMRSWLICTPVNINSTAVSLFVYSLVGGGTHDTYVPPVDAHVWRQLHLSAVAGCSDSYCIFFILVSVSFVLLSVLASSTLLTALQCTWYYLCLGFVTTKLVSLY